MGAVSELNVVGTEAEVTEETTGIVSRSPSEIVRELFVDDFRYSKYNARLMAKLKSFMVEQSSRGTVNHTATWGEADSSGQVR